MLQKNFDINNFNNLSVPHNYFDGSTKLFSDMYLAKFFNISVKFFPCLRKIINRFIKIMDKNREKKYNKM